MVSIVTNRAGSGLCFLKIDITMLSSIYNYAEKTMELCETMETKMKALGLPPANAG